MWTLLSDAGAKVWLYDFLYYWHVPAFVIVTGYLSRNFDYSHERLRALFPHGRGAVHGLRAACWRCSACTSATRTSTTSGPTRTGRCGTSRRCSSGGCSRRVPQGVVRRHPDRGSLVSLVAGIRATDWLDLARVLGLLPFFVIGISLRKEHFEVLHRRWVRVAGSWCSH
jgi:hypothetical protein